MVINVNLRLPLSFCGGWVVGGLGGLYSHFHVQPNYCVEIVLCCVAVGVLTKRVGSPIRDHREMKKIKNILKIGQVINIFVG